MSDLADTKPSDDEVLALELWEMLSTPSLPLLSGLLTLRGVTPDGVLYMGLVEPFDI